MYVWKESKPGRQPHGGDEGYENNGSDSDINPIPIDRNRGKGVAFVPDRKQSTCSMRQSDPTRSIHSRTNLTKDATTITSNHHNPSLGQSVRTR